MNRAFLHVNWHVNNDRSVITAGVLLLYCCFLLINKIHLLQFSCRLRTKRHTNYCPQRKVQFFLERENFQRLQPSKQTRLSAPKEKIYPIFKRKEFANLFVENGPFQKSCQWNILILLLCDFIHTSFDTKWFSKSIIFT